MRGTYLAVNVLVILFPLLFSFERQVRFVRRWRYAWPAIALTAAAFVVWDHFFTAHGLWTFNPKYITGYRILGLPVEEVLFFFTVPYACLFIYAVVGERVAWRPPRTAVLWSMGAAAAVLLAVAALFPEKRSTFTTFSLA